MPETRTVPLADVRAAVGATGRHPRARPVTARFWAELILTAAMFAGVFLADVTALGGADWDWRTPPLLAGWYAVLILCGFAMQLVICTATAQTVVQFTITTGRSVARLVARV